MSSAINHFLGESDVTFSSTDVQMTFFSTVAFIDTAFIEKKIF